MAQARLGDYDCVCSSVDGSHTHIFVHRHEYGADMSHGHAVTVDSPALALPAMLPALSKNNELDAQIRPLYGAGGLDSLPQQSVDDILEFRRLEEKLVTPAARVFSMGAQLVQQLSALTALSICY